MAAKSASPSEFRMKFLKVQSRRQRQWNLPVIGEMIQANQSGFETSFARRTHRFVRLKLLEFCEKHVQ